jgi:hypothetical protein
MIKLNKIEQFQLFCLENYRFSKGISGEIALRNFRQYQVFEYISESYDVLHTQSKIFIVSDINDFIERRL